MFPFLLKTLKGLHSRLDKIIKAGDKPQEIIAETSTFHSLSPIRDADVAQYTAALKWALENRKKESIYNIALTGPYGSGKSSILQTFKAANTNNDYQFLEISLATFKDEIQAEDEVEEVKDDEEKKPGTSKPGNGKKNDDILRLIELSILQQIFYHEEDEKIPDSRFKKIRSFKRKTLRLITIGIILAIVFGVNLFFPKQIEKILVVEFVPLAGHILHWISLAVFATAMALVIYKSIRLVYGLKINKFKFQDAEIEIDKSISKSILNNHLDEILYFFEVTKYSVVYIEDLDRFRQAEIFTKLRELNLLINKSKKVEQDVIFIYAVRDEMFKDKDRTKFFDFIIPVIPVINSSNSNDKLIKVVEDNKYEISNDLIDDVSYFIDDMRLLYNITNEYQIYSSLLDSALPQDKLLAMVVYKNIFPDDFVLLNEGEGKLFKLIQKRSEYINTAVKQIDAEIKENKEELSKIQRTQLKNGDELRLLYVSKFVNKTTGFRSFNINGNEAVTLEGAAKEDTFEYFKAGNFNYLFIYLQHGNYYASNANADFKFEALEKEVDNEQTYEERLDHINSQGYDGEEVIKREIQRLERKKTAIRHAKLQDLLKEPKPSVVIDKTTKQDQLLSILLTSGYINEDYQDYISLFYEGSISKSDRAFLLNVKSQIETDFDFKLNKIEKLIGKIRPLDFQFSYIFNYDLLDFLIADDSFPGQKESLLNQLTNEVELAPSFIDGFINNGTNVEIFIRQLVKKWLGFWKFISENSPYPAEKVYEYFRLIILNGETSSLKNQADGSDLEKRIAGDTEFLSLSPDHEILQNVIGFFNTRFIDVPLEKGNKIMSDFVYQGKFYALSVKMVTEVIKYAGEFNQINFDQKNYHAIKNSGVPELITYVDEVINSYLEEVYFKLPNNKHEPELEYIKLLDNTAIKDKNLVKLIEVIETKISDLGEMSNEAVDDLLFENNKVDPTWNNLAYYHYRHDESINEEVVTFLNNEENATALGEEELDSEILFGDDETLKKFLVQVSHLANINEASFRLISQTFPDDFMVEDIVQISTENMGILIEGGHIYPDAQNFIGLKEHFNPLRLKFLEKAVDDVLGYQDDYQLDAEDIKFIVKSNAFDKEQTRAIINAAAQDVLLKSPAVLLAIGACIVANFPFPVDKAILIGALQQSLPIDDRVKLFNMHYKEFTAADIPVIFKTFPGEFKDIGKLTYSPVIPESTENRYLANNLWSEDLISNVKDDKRGIRIINFKKPK